jgi:hypothetical protein
VALSAPTLLLAEVKHAVPNAAACVMARTVGVLLIAIGTLNFLVRSHEDSQTLRAILIANLVLQLAIMPIDPLAYFNGAFHTLGSFVPNTIIHIVLAAGLAFYLSKLKKGASSDNLLRSSPT